MSKRKSKATTKASKIQGHHESVRRKGGRHQVIRRARRL